MVVLVGVVMIIRYAISSRSLCIIKASCLNVKNVKRKSTLTGCLRINPSVELITPAAGLTDLPFSELNPCGYDDDVTHRE